MQECGRYERITDLFKQRVAVISRSLCPGAILIIGLVETFESVIYLADYQRYRRSTQKSRLIVYSRPLICARSAQ